MLHPVRKGFNQTLGITFITNTHLVAGGWSEIVVRDISGLTNPHKLCAEGTGDVTFRIILVSPFNFVRSLWLMQPSGIPNAADASRDIVRGKSFPLEMGLCKSYTPLLDLVNFVLNIPTASCYAGTKKGHGARKELHFFSKSHVFHHHITPCCIHSIASYYPY